MDGRYQQEIPKARVNITLDIETRGGQKKYELPLKFLLLGDFTGKEKNCPLVQRDRITINRENFNQVMAQLAPGLDFVIGEQLQLNFNSFHDFHPDQIVKKVPKLSSLLAMRNLLKDLKANLSGNRELGARLSSLVNDPAARKSLQAELKKVVFNKEDNYE